MISTKLLAAGGSKKAYLVAANRKTSPDGGIGVFDITDPSNLIHEGDFSGPNLEDPEKVGYSSGADFLVVGGVLGSSFSTFDMRDPANTTEADNLSASGRVAFTMSPDGSYVFSGRSGDEQISTYSISPSGVISLVALGLSPETYFGHGFILAYDESRDLLFGCDDGTNDRVIALDASSPTALVETDELLVSGFDGTVNARHDDARQILFLYETSNPADFKVIDTSNASSLSVLDTLSIANSSRDFDIDPENEIIYLLNNTSLRSVDYSTPSSVSVLQTLSVGSNNQGISYHDGYVYITEFGGKVHSVDVSNPSSMSVVDTITTSPFSNYYQSAIVVK